MLVKQVAHFYDERKKFVRTAVLGIFTTLCPDLRDAEVIHIEPGEVYFSLCHIVYDGTQIECKWCWQSGMYENLSSYSSSDSS